MLEALSEQRAARWAVAKWVHLEREIPRDAESLHQRACSHGSAKPVRELQNLLPRADHTEAHA
jgi:hypothetical protein